MSKISKSDMEFIKALIKRELEALALRIEFDINQTKERILTNIDFIQCHNYWIKRGVLPK